MAVRGLDHINIDTDRPEATIEFYEQVLGLEDREGMRPAFGFPGAWLWAGDSAIIHLNFHSEGEMPPLPTGNLNHIAFEGQNSAEIIEGLESLGLPFTRSDVPGTDLTQVFALDPNGVKLEINIRGE